MAEKYTTDAQHNEVLGEKNGFRQASVSTDPDLLAGAYEAENAEHSQGLWVSDG
jgi:hypothetical protein